MVLAIIISILGFVFLYVALKAEHEFKELNRLYKETSDIEKESDEER